MPIRERTLKDHGSSFIVLHPTDSLFLGFRLLTERNLEINATYIVFRDDLSAWRMALALECVRWLALLGPKTLEEPVYRLPFAAPSRVEQVTMPESGLNLVNWLASRPRSTALVLANETIVGVIANPVRSDSAVIDRTILNHLHGPLAALNDDSRLALERIQPPVCPHCQAHNFFIYNVATMTYHCPKCEQTVQPV